MTQHNLLILGIFRCVVQTQARSRNTAQNHNISYVNQRQLQPQANVAESVVSHIWATISDLTGWSCFFQCLILVVILTWVSEWTIPVQYLVDNTALECCFHSWIKALLNQTVVLLSILRGWMQKCKFMMCQNTNIGMMVFFQNSFSFAALLFMWPESV